MLERSKEKRLINKIRKKENKRKKLLEGIKKMVDTMEIKDGKLTPVKDKVKPVEQPQAEQPTEQEEQPQAEQPLKQEEQPQAEQPPKQEHQTPQEPMVQSKSIVPPVSMTQTERNPFDEQLAIQPQQTMVQPPIQQGNVDIIISLIEGKIITVPIPQQTFDDFITKLCESIDNQSTFQIGKKIINGRHIIDISY